jgi:hypothetical protein
MENPVDYFITTVNDITYPESILTKYHIPLYIIKKKATKAIGTNNEMTLIFYQNFYPEMHIINDFQIYYIAKLGMLENQCSTVHH